MSYYEMPHLQEVLSSLERLLDLKITKANALIRIAQTTAAVGQVEAIHDDLFARLEALEAEKELIRQRLS